jgi:hypothetical protein
MNTLRSYNASGKIMNEMRFVSADKAYAEYEDWLKVAETLPRGYETTIVRYDENGYIMNMHTVIGKA